MLNFMGKKVRSKTSRVEILSALESIELDLLVVTIVWFFQH